MEKIRSYRELRVYQLAFETALEIQEITKTFPKEEKYSLIDQIRRSSRSICVNIGEAWRKRRYPKNFVSKLSDCESELTETEIWLDFALSFDYISKEKHNELYDKYEHVSAMLINMSNNPDKWKL